MVRIVISVSNVASPRIDKNLKIFQKSENPPKNLKISQKSVNLSSVCALKCLYTQTYKCIQVLMFQHNYTKFLWQHLQKKILQWNNYIAQSASAHPCPHTCDTFGNVSQFQSIAMIWSCQKKSGNCLFYANGSLPWIKHQYQINSKSSLIVSNPMSPS